jgi:hypothetical protein
MLVRRALVSSVLLIASALAAQAQMGGQAPPCMNDFLPLRQQAEKRAAAIKAAADRKAPPEEACKLIQQFQAAEAKMISFAEKNNVWCGIPPEVIKQMKAGAVRTQQARTQACAAASAPRARAPSLSEALGTSRAPAPETAVTGRGTFDTLTGNPLGTPATR